MIDSLLFVLTLAGVLGCGLIAGVFFAFSAFVMKALVRLPAALGLEAMQSINVTVINSLFLSVFLGTGGVCVLALAAAFLRDSPGTQFLIAGNLFYLAGVILVTRVCHIPRNEALAAVEATRADYATVWKQFVREWMIWNHVRAAASLAAAALLLLALREMP
jgi:uncharacterized membrane protein